MPDTTRLPAGIWIEVDTSAVASPVNTIVRDSTDGQLYVSTNAVTPTYTQLSNASGVATQKLRLQLGDLPAATSTGTTFWGTALPAGALFLGASAYFNSAIALGGGGVTAVTLATGLGDNPGGSQIFQVTADVPLQGKGIGPISAYSDATDFINGPAVAGVAQQPYYGLTATGGNLNTLAAFDLSIVYYYVPIGLTFP